MKMDKAIFENWTVVNHLLVEFREMLWSKAPLDLCFVSGSIKKCYNGLSNVQTTLVTSGRP